MKTQLLPLSQLDAPHEWHRKPSKIEDDALRRSIEEGGIQQPLFVVPHGKRFICADGIRRMKVAGLLDIAKVPAVIEEAPAGIEPKEHARQLRFMLDELRQDLRPSQRAELIEKLKAQFGMTNIAVSQYLGVDQDSITNWLSVRRYVPEVVQAMDRGQLTMQAARVFDGMSEKGQRKVWSKHAAELLTAAGGKMHQHLRTLYPPTSHPEFYTKPEKIAARLAKKGPAKRKRVAKPSFTPAEKQRLLTSFEFRDAELKDAKTELQQLKRECLAAGPIVAAIRRNTELWTLVPEEMQAELERFGEVY